MSIAEITKFGSFQYVDASQDISDTDMLECLNMVSNKNGGLVSRPGTAGMNFPTAANALLYPIGVVPNGAGTSFILMYDGTNFVTSDLNIGSVTVFAKGASAGFLGGDTADDGAYYVPSATTAIKKITRTAVVDTTGLASNISIPCRYHLGRMFAVSTTEPWKLYYTDVNTYTAWPSANVIPIGNSTGSVVSMVSVGERLIVFKSDAIYILYTSSTPSNWVLRKLENVPGNSSGPSVGNVPLINGRIYFGTSRGVFVTDGVSIKNISEPFLSTLYAVGNFAVTTLYQFSDNLLYVAVTGTSAGNKYFLYDINENKWSRYSNSVVSGMSYGIRLPGDVGQAPTYILGPGATNKYLVKVDPTVYTDSESGAATAITKTVRTRYFTFGSRFNIKRTLQLWAEVLGLSGSTPTYSVGYYADSSTLSTLANDTCPTTGESKITQSAGPEYFKRLSLYWTSTATSKIQLLALGAELIVKEPVD